MVGVEEEEASHLERRLWEAIFAGGCVLLLQHYVCAVMFVLRIALAFAFCGRKWQVGLGWGLRWEARLERESGVPHSETGSWWDRL